LLGAGSLSERAGITVYSKELISLSAFDFCVLAQNIIDRTADHRLIVLNIGMVADAAVFTASDILTDNTWLADLPLSQPVGFCFC
jgi:hypothetical protein